VDTRWVLNCLNVHQNFILWSLEHIVVFEARGLIAKGGAPERGGGFEVIAVAIYGDFSKATLVHRVIRYADCS
jgi:hypothetical protein